MREPKPAIFSPLPTIRRPDLFHRDPNLLAKHFALAPAAPLASTLTAHSFRRVAEGWRDRARPSNNHLSYALTWFGLAITLFAYLRPCLAKALSNGKRACHRLWPKNMRHQRSENAGDA